MKKIYSAPASIILSGEYSYQYGKPVLLCAIKDVTSVCVGNDVKKESIDTRIMKEYIYFFLKKRNISFTKINKSVSFDFLLGRVLNSEYAKYIALTAAILDLALGNSESVELVNEIVFHFMKQRKETLPDAESSVSSFGGLLLYRKEFDFLKYVTRLNLSIPSNIEKNLIYFPVDFSLRTLQQAIDKLYLRDTLKTEHLLHQTEKTTRRIIISFIKEDFIFFKNTINDQQKLLEDIDVFPTSIKKMCQNIRDSGGGAKVIYDGFSSQSKAFLLIAKNEKINETYKHTYLFNQAKEGLISRSREDKSPAI